MVSKGESVPAAESETVVVDQETSSVNHDSPKFTYVTKTRSPKAKKRPRKYVLKEEYIDIIKDTFWESKPWILV